MSTEPNAQPNAQPSPAPQPSAASKYKSALKPIWCPGCGDFGVLNAVYNALNQLGLPTHKVAIVSGIGCSSRLPGYVRCYGINTLHGRAFPIATGVKLGNPELTVIVTGGDGDGISIGGNHLLHSARRNLDVTYIMMDNQIYGLTKGQASPTSQQGQMTSTTTKGNWEDPIEPVSLALGINASFIARGFSGDLKHLTKLIVAGIQHKGFSFLTVRSPCVTYTRTTYKELQEKVVYLENNASYDPSDRFAAMKVAQDTEHLHLGVIYRNQRLSYLERLGNLADTLSEGKTRKVEDAVEEYVA